MSVHGPSQSGPYSRVRDLLATFTLNFSLIATESSAAAIITVLPLSTDSIANVEGPRE